MRALRTNPGIIPLTSRSNPIIKRIRSLHNRKFRDQEKEFFIEGLKYCTELLSSNYLPEFLVLSNEFSCSASVQPLVVRAQSRKIPVYQVPVSMMAELSGLRNPPGMLAVTRQPTHLPLEQWSQLEGGCILFADRVQDPGNLGGLLRTVDALGAAGMVTCQGGVDIFHPSAVRGSAGSVLRTPVHYVQHLRDWVELARQMQLKIIMAYPKANKGIRDIDPGPRFTLIVGHEGKGIKQEDMELGDELIRVSMREGSESLNVTAATAIILYELLNRK